MSEEDQKAFEKTVSDYLREGLHTRRGLTAEAYTALCRKAWDECQQPSPEFPFKLLIDPLRPVESMLANSSQEYVHWRAADAVEATRQTTDIYCNVLGPVKPDLSPGPSDDDQPLSTDEPIEPETRRYILAVFDVLGFSALLRARGLETITSLYSQLIHEAVTKEAMRTYNMIRFSETQSGTVLFALPIRHAHFSDTIIL